jgi:hypothetical protein
MNASPVESIPSPSAVLTEARVQLFDGPGKPFRLRRVPLPVKPAPGEVLVRMKPWGTWCKAPAQASRPANA